MKPRSMSISKAKYTTRTATDRAVRCWFDPGILIWSLVVALWSPFALFHRVRRSLFRKKKDPFVRERWTAELQTAGITHELLSKPGAHIVIVGASFGEVVIIDKITRAIKSERPGAKVTWAIRDHHTVEHVKKMHTTQSVVFWPYDWVLPVVRWMKTTQPDVLIMVEKFRFPIFVHAAKKYGADVVLVSGRCKARLAVPIFSALYFKWLFGAYRTVFLQNETYMNLVSPLIKPRTKAVVTGDVKFDLSHIPIAPEKAAAVDLWIKSAGDAPILAVGSTDCCEEERFVLDAYMAVRKKHDVRLMMAPRRPSRLAETVETLESYGLTVSLRSKMDGPADVYVLDTLGELSYTYKFAIAAYVGGALLGMGHNVIEPLEWGIPVSYGPNRGNFGSIQES